MRIPVPTRWLATVAAACLTVPLLAVTGAAPAQAAPGDLAGYVWGHSPVAAHYVAATGYEYNSTGGQIEIARSGVGRYQVRFEGMAATGGVAHASAYGTTSSFCKLQHYGPRDRDLVLAVLCFDHDGTPTDSRFVANYTDRTPAVGTAAWLWSTQPVPPAAGYTPADWFDSTGQAPVVTRTGVGRYQVDLGALTVSFPQGHLQGVLRATATGHDAVRCEVLDPRLQDPWTVPVRCHRADGSFVDSAFTVTLAHGVDLLGAANPMSGSAMVHPSPVVDPTVSGWTNPGGPPTAVRLAAGRYQVTFPGLAMPRGHAVAHVFGTPQMYCHVSGWWPAGPDQVVEVNCRQPNGALTDVWGVQVTVLR